MRSFPVAFLVAGLMTIAGCGGHSSSSSNSGSSSGNTSGSNPASGANVDAISVNSGPIGGYPNGIFTSVTLCAPGSSSCQSINGVLVDTGSYGLRVLSSALSTLALPQQTDASGNPIAECAHFSDGITWGSIRTADIKIAGEVASSVAVQVIGDSKFSTVPANCSKAGRPMDDQKSLLANGIIGIGPFRQDCPACSIAISNPGLYYACPTSTTCTVTTEAISQQVQNPVWMFPVDNNGTILELPSIPAAGVTSVSGSLIFGIGTQSNNGMGSAKVFTLDGNGFFTTQFDGASYSKSFVDSGSNGFFFDNTNAKLPTSCNPGISGFYCPSTTQNFSATQQGGNGTSNTVNFSIANANVLFCSTCNNWAFNDLGGPSANTFDWGLPFFFGRNVITAIESQPTPAGIPGPYVAY